MQGTNQPGMAQTPPGMVPTSAPVDPYAALIGTLQRQIKQATDKMERDQAALSASEMASIEARNKQLTPIRTKISSAIDKLIGDVGAPQEPDMPAWKGGPIVNEQDYTKFGFIALGMAMVGGALSKGNWLGATASLNGSLKGYINGSMEVAKRQWQDFQEQYQEAVDKYNIKLRRYHDIIGDQTLSINSMFQQYQLAADAFNDEALRYAVQHKDLDAAQKHIDSLDRMLETAMLAHAKVNSQVGGVMAGNDAGVIAMIEAGVPLTRVAPGLSTAMSAYRNNLQRQAIQDLSDRLHITLPEAGQLLAQRQAQYLAGNRSVSQQMVMLGATEGLLQNLEFQLKWAQIEIDKLGTGLTDLSPVLNALARGEEYWSGDPGYSRLFIYMNAAMQDAARIQLGGAASIAQLHEGARTRAEEMISMGWTTPKMFKEGIAPALRLEGHNRVQNFTNEIRAQEGRMVSDPNVVSPVPAMPGEQTAIPLGMPGAGTGETPPPPPMLTPDQLDDQQYGR